MLTDLGGTYVDHREVAAVFPPEPGVVDCAVVLLKNGHMLEVDLPARQVLTRLSRSRRELAARKWRGCL